MKDRLVIAIKLYIQIVKVLDGEKELDDESRETFLERYREVFGTEKEFFELSDEKLSQLRAVLERIFAENKQAIYEILHTNFNTFHNQFLTAQTYNAISYESESVIREVLQNVFDRAYDTTLLLSVKFAPEKNEISISYNEKGFDWKSLIFYFHAGDSNKSDAQTGRFGLGIKSVMYNVTKLSVMAKGPDGKKLHWNVTCLKQKENKYEEKKSLQLSPLVESDEEPQETTVTFTLEKELYLEIEKDFRSLMQKESSSGKYIDLPELTFAFAKTFRKQAEAVMTLFINEREINWSKSEKKIKILDRSEGAELKFHCGYSNYEKCDEVQNDEYQKLTYLEAMLFLESEGFYFDNSSLYATYRLGEDRSFRNAGGGIFVSVKSKFVESHRKSLKQADENREKIREEAEQIVCQLYERNAGLLKVVLRKKEEDILEAEYSNYLRMALEFVQKTVNRQRLAKLVKIPNALEDGMTVRFLHHSTIAAYRYGRYAESNKNQTLYYGMKDTGCASYSYNKLKELLAREVAYCTANKAECLVILDFYQASYRVEENVIDTSNISYEANYQTDASFSKFIKEIKAAQLAAAENEYTGGKLYFPARVFYGGNDTLPTIGVEALLSGTVEDYYCSMSSIFTIIKRLISAKDGNLQIITLKDTIGTIPDARGYSRKQMILEDMKAYETCGLPQLQHVYREEYERLKRDQIRNDIQNNPEITFGEMIEKYGAYWVENKNMALGKKVELLPIQTLSYLVRQNQKFSNKLQTLKDANKSVSGFLARLDVILNQTYVFFCKELKEPFRYLIDENELVIPFPPYFQEIRKPVILVFPPDRSGSMRMASFKNYINEVLKGVGIKNFADLDKTQTNVVYSDQLPMVQKIAYPLTKGQYRRIYEKYRRDMMQSSYKKGRVEKCKELLIRDMTPAYYGNGYCCCVKECDFSVSSSFAYNALEFKYRNFSARAIVCRNHEELLKNVSNGNISIIDISFGDKQFDDFFAYVKTLGENDKIPSRYRKVKIEYLERYKAEIFDPNRENDDSEETSKMVELELSPVTFACWIHC